MRSRILAWSLVGVAALAMSSPMVSAKPPSGGGNTTPSTSFVPEILYQYAGNQGPDLRLSNETGTASMLVARSSYSMEFDLAPRTANGAQFAYTLCDSLGYNCAAYVNSWSYDPAGQVKLGTARQVLQVRGSINGIDFSPDGQHVAVVAGGYGVNGLWVYDTATGVMTRVRDQDRWWRVRWSSDGRSILGMGGDTRPLQIMNIATFDPATRVTTPIVPGSVLSGPHMKGGDTFDVSRPSAAPQQILLDWQEQYTQPTYVWSYVGEGSSAIGTRLTLGDKASFNCDNSRFIFRHPAGRFVETRIATADGSSTYLWSSDRNIRLYDWMNCAV
jgi:WD40 repeat protein